ncbi:hypothetical protein FFB58_10485 [Enterobacter sp. MF024]|uniref:hypothetical protein n=1 Tax=Enterobacter sp. MF024 TaxID=2555644 RepID=UPI0011067BFB|nr:hypothetical protein [Enterobacter sp. MF024]TLU68308.1 hypothetical protein FFB58_10485 [Enterobacter sp. MF024]
MKTAKISHLDIVDSRNTDVEKEMTRVDLINAGCSAICYVKQVKGVLTSLMDIQEAMKDDEESWRLDALLTLAHMAQMELEKIVNSTGKEPK